MRAGLLILISAFGWASAAAQVAAPFPRAPDGHPDLQGVWATRFVTRLEKADGATGVDVSPEEARRLADAIIARDKAMPVNDPDNDRFNYDQLAHVNGSFRAGLIVEPKDGMLPYSSAGLAVADRADAQESFGFDNPEERPGYERCITGQGAAPIRPLPLYIPNQIVQTPDAIMVWTEDVQGARVIWMTGKPMPAAIQPRNGFSYGRWDGDTLVVETTGFRADDTVRPQFGRPVVIGRDSKVVERFIRLPSGELLYQFTVEDAGLYAKPWLAEYVMKLEAGGAVYEYACHEANYSMVNMLRAGRLGRQPKPKAK
jgi:hypothetical protein